MKHYLKSALSLTTLALLATSAQAVLPHEVKCANGKTNEVPDSVTPWEACLTIGSQPADGNSSTRPKFTEVSMKRGATDQQKAAKYSALAAKHRPTDVRIVKLVDAYMKLPPSRRNAFKADNPGVPADIWDFGPYAVCFYASVAGGADVVEAGDECHDDWVD
jgi:hypothetical protein